MYFLAALIYIQFLFPHNYSIVHVVKIVNTFVSFRKTIGTKHMTSKLLL